MGMIQKGGIWYFSDIKGSQSWPKIQGRYLHSFPNHVFNQHHGIGNEEGLIRNGEELKKLFATLGLTVATDEQEKERAKEIEVAILIPRWRQEIELSEEKFVKIGILRKNGAWYFGDAKGMDNWFSINGRNLISFPNSSFNKSHKIGNKEGSIQNPEDLKHVFRVIGLNVASDEQQAIVW